VLLFLTVLGGCYTYQAVLGEDLGPGDPVRLRLASEPAQRLSARVGSAVRSVEGPLLRTTPDSLRLSVTWGAYYAGTMFEGRQDTLQFHRSEVLEVDRREFSRVRTGVVVAALTTAVVVLFKAINLGGQAGDDPPIDPPLIVIPGR
jgi:hypothetical protein